MAEPIHHTRSSSFPRRSNPTLPQLDEILCRITSSKSASCSSTINGSLSCLRDLHECINDLLLLPSTHQSLTKDSEKKQVDKVLDGLLSILDLCGTTKDVLIQTKEHVQKLLSILRRRRGNDSELGKEIGEYLASRKRAKKAIRNGLKDLKSKALKENQESTSLASILSQAQGASLSIFESILHYVSGSIVNSRSSGWTLASKLIRSKWIGYDDATEENEFAAVDVELTLLGHRAAKSCPINSEDVQGKLNTLESCIKDIEDELEFQFRQLIKIRVSLLNTLSY